MEVYEGKIAVTFDELTATAGGEAVMARGTLKGLLARHPEYRLSKGGGLGQVCRIDFDMLRDYYKKRFISKYGDPRKILAEQALRAELNLTIDANARQYYSNYRYTLRGELKALPEAIVEELTLNASILKLMTGIISRRSVLRKAAGRQTTTKELLETISEVYEKLRDAYGHTLPTSLGRLRSKLAAYKEDGYVSLISKKWGNNSAAIITEEAGEYLIALKRSKVPVYTDSMMLAAYNDYAARHDWKQLKSLRAMRDWLNRPEIRPLWYDAAHGELASHQLFSRKHDTTMPTMRDSLWYGDGTKLNLYYKEWVEGKGKGRWEVRTLQVYEVIDAYSEVLLGYNISETENYASQYAAYRMAVATSGHRPFEIVHDNQGGHNKLSTENFLNRLPSGLNRPTAPNSGQSKTIENLFGRLQDEYLRRDWRFTGMNITAKKVNSRINLEFIAANKDNLYTRAELIAAYEDIRKEWNAAAHPKTGVARQEMYNSSTNPATPALTEMDMVEVFWLLTDRPVAYTSSGLSITIKGETHHYEVCTEAGDPDHEFYWKNNGRKYRVKYDPCDLRSIRLYTESPDGLRFERTAEIKIAVQRNIQEQKEGDQAFIRANIAADIAMRKTIQIKAQTIERKYGMSVEQQGLKRPGMSNVPQKVNDEVTREVVRRTRKMRATYGSMTPAQFSKEVSLSIINPETKKVDLSSTDLDDDYAYGIASKF